MKLECSPTLLQRSEASVASKMLAFRFCVSKLLIVNNILEYNFVSVTDDDDVLIVGFADAQFDTQHYLMFQRSLDEDESDEDVYVERDGQNQSTYGGIEKLMLFRNKALFNFDLKTSQWFNQLKIGFEKTFAGKKILEIK